MNRLASVADMRQLGTVLGIWAHPDDESFLAAGVLMAALQNGQQVICITATQGELGVRDEARWPQAELGDIRTKEIAAAFAVLGIKQHHWLGYRDGACADVDEAEAVSKLTPFIEQYKPDSILTFGPDGWTGHPDHQSVSRWTTAAVKASTLKPKVYHVVGNPENYENYLKLEHEKINIFFNIDKPPLEKAEDCDICFELPEDICDKKCAALKAMPSQTADLFEQFDMGFLHKSWNIECFKLAE